MSGAIIEEPQRRGALMRLMGSAVGSQAILSAASLGVGLLLIRRTSAEQYGAWILVVNAFLLLSSLQNAFFAPTLILRMTPLPEAQRGPLIGGLQREQRRLLQWLCLPLGLAVAACGALGLLSLTNTALLLAAVIAVPAILSREYLRIAAMNQQLAHEVVRADLLYALLLVAGAALATWSPLPAATAVAGLALAALAGAMLLSHTLQRRYPWGEPQTGLLRQIVTLGAWSTAGAAIHWSFSQGYSYVVAATLDVGAVAAIGATRLLLMPVNLLSTGVGSMMLPMAAEWQRRLGFRSALRRMLLVVLGLAGATLCYLAVMWLLRDWIFTQLLHKQFAGRDALLLWWSAIALLMLLRDQTVPLMVARGSLRRLTLMTLCSALLSLLASIWGMRHYGVPGALFGVACGEAANLAGIFSYYLLEHWRERVVAPAATAVPSAPSN